MNFQKAETVAKLYNAYTELNTIANCCGSPYCSMKVIIHNERTNTDDTIILSPSTQEFLGSAALHALSALTDKIHAE